MERLINKEIIDEDELDNLCEKLLTERIEPGEFLDSVLDLDQSDPERKSSLRAVEVLSKPEIVELFENSSEKIQFYSVRSLSYFHKAQVRISEGDTDVEDDLKMALNDSLEAGSEDIDWTNYVKATIAYLNNDLEELKKLEGDIKLNRSLVRNFIQGLEERGRPDYLTDYGKLRDESLDQ